jgi:hypothetical protein
LQSLRQKGGYAILGMQPRISIAYMWKFCFFFRDESGGLT